MSMSDVAVVLAKVQAYDNRNVEAAHIQAWSEALVDTDLRSALDAVAVHFTRTTEWIMPAHVNRIVTDYDGFQRPRMVREFGEPTYPPTLRRPGRENYDRRYYAVLAGGGSVAEALADADGAYLRYGVGGESVGRVSAELAEYRAGRPAVAAHRTTLRAVES